VSLADKEEVRGFGQAGRPRWPALIIDLHVQCRLVRARLPDVSPRLVLVEGRTLVELMVELDIGVQDRDRYGIKRIDEDFFEDVS
jgi:hypothetical protein